MENQHLGLPVLYRVRARNHYRALGYTKDYFWAHYVDVPFVRPNKPVSGMRIALICTAGPADRSHCDEHNRRHVWSGLVSNPPREFRHRCGLGQGVHTHRRPRETFLPIDAAQRLVAARTLNALAPRFHTAPTDYSQQKTDAPEILRRL